jgi:hypothetical protein
VPDDRLAAAVAELYGGAPEMFTGRRGELAAAAREAGDRAAAKAIGALRRPTRAAWVVNQLARADPGAAARLAGLAGALRAAQAAGDGRRLRELSVERDGAIDGLTARALDVAGVADPPVSLVFEVSQTLTAALADPEVAAAFAAGTLTRAEQWSGFGVLPAVGGSGRVGGARKPGAANAAPAKEPAADGRASRGPADTARSRPRAAARPPAAAPAADAARQQAEADERLAREAAEREARRREQYQDAERVVVAATTATTEAAAAEDRLEAEVRDLEQRLVQARTDLAAARMRARHAEAAERRARQALDRLPHPLRTYQAYAVEGDCAGTCLAARRQSPMPSFEGIHRADNFRKTTALAPVRNRVHRL